MFDKNIFIFTFVMPQERTGMAASATSYATATNATATNVLRSYALHVLQISHTATLWFSRYVQKIIRFEV